MAKERTLIKEGKNFKAYSDGSVFVMNVRASYPNIAVPFEGVNDDGKETKTFGIRGLAKKATHKEAKAYLDGMITDFLKKAKIDKIKPESKFIKDGDLDDKSEYEGHWVISANEKTAPRLRDRRGNRIDPSTYGSDKYPFFPGCLCNILIRPWWMNNKFGKKVNANLVAVQFVLDDGVVFGEGRISDDQVDDTITSLDDGDDDNGYGDGPESEDLDTGDL